MVLVTFLVKILINIAYQFIKSVKLGYTIPSKWLSHLRLIDYHNSRKVATTLNFIPYQLVHEFVYLSYKRVF